MNRWPRWIALGLVAFVGSAFYGASLAHAISGWQLTRGALWLTLSAGTGWILLGPTLLALTRLPLRVIADACLVAMAIGEGVLAFGAMANFALPMGTVPAVPFNIGVVALSNVVMAAVLTSRLKREGASPWTVLGAWVLVLDGGGAIAFWIFHRLIFGGGS